MAQPASIVPQSSVSSQIQQLMSAHQLGTLIAEYKVAVTTKNIIYSIIFLIIGVFFLALGFATNSDNASSFIVFLLIGICAFLAGCWLLVRPLVYRNLRVYVCTEGMIYTKGATPAVIRWDQIRASWQSVTKHYYNGVYAGTTHIYTVERMDGAKFVFNDRFKDVEKLGNTIAHQVTNKLLPQVIAAYNAGQAITFGNLTVNQQGVSNGKELLPWPLIKNIQVKRGMISIQKEGKWLNWSNVPVSKTPNFIVFMALVDYVVKGAR